MSGIQQMFVAGGGLLPTPTVDYLLLAGGGGGGYGTAGGGGGGGGAGGLLTGTGLSVAPAITYNIVVGGGGGGGAIAYSVADMGGNSRFGSLVNGTVGAIGGGGGGSGGNSSTGGPGGSGGGAGIQGAGHTFTGGARVPGQGNIGGDSTSGNPWPGGSGGGAGAAGTTGGNGGIGITSSIISTTLATSLGIGDVRDSAVYFAGGGGTGNNTNYPSHNATVGGLGGGGRGATLVFASRQLVGTNGLVVPVYEPAWNTFMNTYCVWGTDSGADSTIDVSTTVNFPYTGVYAFQTGFDNSGTIYLDGVSVASGTDTFNNTQTNNVTVTAGNHTVRITGRNGSGRGAGPGGTALVISGAVSATSGTDNTGGGGGGGDASGGVGGNGGSGVVIIRYPSTYREAITTGSLTITISGGYRIYIFTSDSGSITF
jgi:hypothetical protein